MKGSVTNGCRQSCRRDLTPPIKIKKQRNECDETECVEEPQTCCVPPRRKSQKASGEKPQEGAQGELQKYIPPISGRKESVQSSRMSQEIVPKKESLDIQPNNLTLAEKAPPSIASSSFFSIVEEKKPILIEKELNTVIEEGVSTITSVSDGYTESSGTSKQNDENYSVDEIEHVGDEEAPHSELFYERLMSQKHSNGSYDFSSIVELDVASRASMHSEETSVTDKTDKSEDKQEKSKSDKV